MCVCRFAELALRENRYNADALVNRSNVFVAEGELDNAQQMFLEAIGVDADCTEAIFNLGRGHPSLRWHELLDV